jgi:hypothetical protein
LAGPAGESLAELVTAGQDVVFDEEAADVFAGWRSGELVEACVGDVGRCCQLAEEAGDVGLLYPSKAAVGSFHGFQRCCDGLQFGGRCLFFRREEPVDCCCEDAGPAAVSGVDLIFVAAADAVDVEFDAGAFAAGRERVYPAGQDTLVAAGAAAPGSFGLLVAVATDSAVGPADDDLVVF